MATAKVKGPLPRNIEVGNLTAAEIAMLNALTLAELNLPAGISLNGVILDTTRPPTVVYSPSFDPVLNLAIITVQVVANATGAADVTLNQASHIVAPYTYYLFPVSVEVVGVASYPTPVLNAHVNQGVHWSATDTVAYEVTFYCMVGKVLSD